MDPLSMTASIIAILELTGEVFGFVNSALHATEDQKRIATEASNLSPVLTNLKNRVEEARTGEEWFDQVRVLNVQNGPLDQFKGILRTIVEKLNITPSPKVRERVKSIVLWKYTKSELEESLARIDRLRSLISMALDSDLFKLSQAIRGEIRDLKVLTHQSTQQITQQVEAGFDRTHQMTHQITQEMGTGFDRITQQMSTGFNRLQAQANQDMGDKLFEWLMKPNPSRNYDLALKKRHPQTGVWLLTHPLFEEWKSLNSSLLWLHGNAGCGKTVLSATALEDIIKEASLRDDVTVGYHYFDFNDKEKQCPLNAICSLLFQVGANSSDGIEALTRLYHLCGKGKELPTPEQVQSLFGNLCSQAKQTYIVLDALDECEDRDTILSFIETTTASKHHKVCILATSRREQDIEQVLGPIAHGIIDVQSTEVDEDIKMYVRDQVSNSRHLKSWSLPLREEIIATITDKANGMFRWVSCQLEALRPCRTPAALREALNSLPKTLDDTYARILSNIESKGDLADAIRVMQWLCFSYRPLKLKELVVVLAIQGGEGEGDDERFDPDRRLANAYDIIEICGGLVTCYTETKHVRLCTVNSEYTNDTDPKDNELLDETSLPDPNTMVRLAHYSVKEYFTSNRYVRPSEFQAEMCHKVICRNCIMYIRYLDQAGLHLCTEQSLFWIPSGLADYAAKYWGRHAYDVGETRHTPFTEFLVEALLNRGMFVNFKWTFDGEIFYQEYGPSRETTNDLKTPVYHAALLGLSEVVQSLTKQGHNVDTYGGMYGSPLQAACCQGHEKTVDILLAAGADVEGLRLHSCNPSKYIHLDCGQDTACGTPLQMASHHGYGEIVRKLIAAGADVQAQKRWWECVQLDEPRRMRTRRAFYVDPLQAASIGGHEIVVKMLLDAGADVNAQGPDHGGALRAASYWGRDAVVEVLLAAGADVNQHEGFDTALTYASRRGHRKIVKRLLSVNADPNAPSTGDRPLVAASREGHEDIVHMLLDAGADANLLALLDVNPRKATSKTPLSIAEEHIRWTTVCFFICLYYGVWP